MYISVIDFLTVLAGVFVVAILYMAYEIYRLKFLEEKLELVEKKIEEQEKKLEDIVKRKKK